MKIFKMFLLGLAILAIPGGIALASAYLLRRHHQPAAH